MVIVYESKTGFTKRYANMLANKKGLKLYNVKEIKEVSKDEEIIFLGWMKVGKIQGLKRVRKYNIVCVIGSGTGRIAEPSEEVVISRNKIENLPFFYLRGGCLPLRDLKGMDKFMLSMFVKVLQKQKNKDESQKEAISNIINGYNGVKEENLEPVLKWLKER